MPNDAPLPWADFGLATNPKGAPYANVANAVILLQKHPFYANHIWYDPFHGRIRTDLDLSGVERSWTDADEIDILEWMQRFMKLPTMGLPQVQQAVLFVAHADIRRHPATYLKSLRWDGHPRVDDLAVTGFGAIDSPYTRSAGANFAKSFVARMSNPGCKVDTVLVLEGAQGTGKTRALRIIGGEFYAELHSQFGSKDAIQELQGKALLELAELEGLPKRESEVAKAFISRVVDTYRQSYARHPIDVPRSCIFVGTTNEHSYLRDATGARRFWPLRTGTIDLDWIEVNRDQLLAEAYERVSRLCEPWWDMPIDETQREQRERYEGDPWSGPIERFLVGLDSVTSAELLSEALHLDYKSQDKRGQMRVGKILRHLGWTVSPHGPTRRNVWFRPETRPGVSLAEVSPIKSPLNHDAETQERREIPF